MFKLELLIKTSEILEVLLLLLLLNFDLLFGCLA